MMRKLISVATVAFCLSLPPGGLARSQEEKAAASEETTWKIAKVVETARPETVTFKPLQWPPLTVSREKAPEGYGWLVVVVELKPPQPKAKLKVSSVRLVDSSSKENGVFALSYYQEPWNFETVADFPAGVVSVADQAFWEESPEDNELALSIYEGKEGLVALLFRVPVGAEKFRLQVDGGEPVAVPQEEPQTSESSPG